MASEKNVEFVIGGNVIAAADRMLGEYPPESGEYLVAQKLLETVQVWSDLVAGYEAGHKLKSISQTNAK